MFAHLHLHSEYSLLDGMCNLKKLIPMVDALGQTAVAVTDHGSFHAPIKLYSACKDYKEKTGRFIKPIYGIEVYVTPDIGNVIEGRQIIEDNKKQIVELEKNIKAIKALNKGPNTTIRAIRKKLESGKHESKRTELTDQLEKLIAEVSVRDQEIADIIAVQKSLPVKIADWFNWKVNEDEAYFGNGTEIVSEDLDEEEEQDERLYRYAPAHLVLLAKDNQGFYNLMQIATDSQLHGFYKKPRVDLSILRQYGKGIIALSACRGGEIPRLILRHREDLAIRLIEIYKEIFDEFYLELQPPVVPEQAYINSVLISLAEQTDTPLVATADAHYLKREDAKAHEDLMKMQTGGKFWFKEQCYFVHTEDEMRSYEFPEEALTNTQLIADKCNVVLDFSTKVPKVAVPEGYDANTYLRSECFKGLYTYLANNQELDKEAYIERLEFELNVFTSKNLSDFLLIIADIIQYAKTHNILMGPGRGSSGGSLICMCLGITDIDPIKYKLLFERMISIDRPSNPDVFLTKLTIPRTLSKISSSPIEILVR